MVNNHTPPLGQRKGVWEPLPLIVFGYAVHPLSPNRRDTKLSSRTRASNVTGTTDVSADEHLVHRDVVSLEVGDNVYAFEKYTPKDKEVEGVWYRGYVVYTSRRPQVNWALVSDPSCSTQKAAAKADDSQQVFIGIFPASHIFVRDELSDAEGRLAELANTLRLGMNGHQSDIFGHWNKDKITSGAATPREEDGLSIKDGLSRKSFKLTPPPDQANSARARLPVHPPSVRSASPTESQVLKPLPPRPSLKSGDDTASGAEQPIVDEIASALREWHALMFQYLARRDYKLFQIVREHIEALHLGRRQLLAQTLSSEETVNLSRECVARLVKGNLVQGLDVIVRHPTGGGLVTVEVEGEIDPRSWMSALRMYALQVSLAYMDVSPPTHPYRTSHAATSHDHPASTTSQVHSVFTEHNRKVQPRITGSFGSPSSTQPSKAKFYHVFLDLRAFVASPCVPGETAELIFSLYNRNGERFVSEDFCAVLNHNGVLARDPSARIRTLFTDLVQSDAQDPIYLVCKIVRNGSMKIGSGIGSISGNARRTSEASVRESGRVNGHAHGDSMLPGDYRSGSPGDFPVQFRRPFGCAVLELTQLSAMAAEQSEVSSTKEHTMPIFVPKSENTFSMLHQDIMNNNNKEYEKSDRAETMAVSIKIFYGDADTIVRENTSLLQDIPLSLRLGFPDVVFPGDVRNELYVKLWSGDFSAWQAANARRSVTNFARQVGSVAGNVQVTIEVKDQNGRTIDDVISQCSGEPPMAQWHSMVFQRTSQPTFGELIKLKLPLDGAQQWHLFFTFRHRNAKDKSGSRGSELPERPFAFAFLPLFPDGRAFLEDYSHTLVLYRADRLSQIPPELYLAATPWLPANQRPEQVFVPVELQKFAPPMRDSLIIRSELCSTKFTQNSVLLSLLNWETLADTETLSIVLTKFAFVPEVEIVKFLRDIFDSLFAILVSTRNQTQEMDHLVFNALVTVLQIVQDRRFSNFQPVLDVYIERHFSCASASSHMVHSMNCLLQNPAAPETASALRDTLKVWHYIFKFIVRSRELQKAKELGIGGGATAEHLEAPFKRELRAHLSEVNRMMSTTTPSSIIGTQTIALQHFTSILPELDKVFETVELVSIATAFANAVASNRGKIVIWKLMMYLQIVKGFMFDKPQSRALLVENVVFWLKPHFGRFDEYVLTQPSDSEKARDAARVLWLESIRLSVTVVAIMLDKCLQNLVQPSIVADRNALRQEQDNIEYLLSLFPRLLDSYLEYKNPASQRAIERSRSTMPISSSYPVTFPDSYPFSLAADLPKISSPGASSPTGKTVFSPGLGETAVVLLVLVLSAPKKHLLGFLESIWEIEGSDNFASILLQCFKVASSILDNDAFPNNWLNVNILAHKVLIKLMDPIATLLEREYLPHDDSPQKFDANLWRECFCVLLKLLSSEQLVIEEFIPQKRRAVWRLGGDIRGEGAALMLRLWEALGWTEEDVVNGEPSRTRGNYQAALSPLVGHVVNLCLSHHDQLRYNAVHILYCMIISEYHFSGHFQNIENELVSKLDTLFMSDSKGDDISRAFFIGYLRHLFETSEVDDQLRARVTSFLEEVDQFLELLLSVRALPEGEEFADDRVIATLRLMNFIRRIGRDEIYIKYVHQLVNMHLQAQNYVEAALTLKLHADLHAWDLNTFAPPMEELGLPQQSHFHRKETLCLLILDYLGKGKAWESAIEICKELALQHAEVTFNYARLAEILRHEAALLEHIISDQRYYSDYFRVAFWGNFPAAIRNKQFIYRGYEWEKFGAFCERMLNKHPGVQLLKTMGDPPVDIRFGTQLYIQCTAVIPEPDRELPIFTNPDVSPPIRAYYEHSAINLFSYSRPLTKVGQDGSEEVWTEKTYLTTEETFPTVLRRSEVVGTELVEISPVQSALQEIEQRTRELSGLNLRFSALAKTSQSIPTNALTMSLNTAVDAPINSGIGFFRQAYLNDEYVQRHPERAEEVEKLRNAIDEQVRTIHSCLQLHGQLCPPEMIAFHGTMEKFFRKNFQEEIQRLAVDVGSSSRYVDQVSSPRTASRALPLLPRPNIGVTVQVGNAMNTPMVSPTSSRSQKENGQFSAELQSSKQTPLQRHLAHLARHGFNGVSSGPGDVGSGDSISEESPRDSFIVNNGIPIPMLSGAASVTSATLGSIGSIRGRLSKFSSLNFTRREGL